jgi:CRP/FNR family cyclic AMP-dependent transcriptional regulator
MKIITPDFTNFSDFFDEAAICRYGAGDYIFHDGDKGECMYVVMEGQLQVEAGGRQLFIMEKGDVLGEMAVIDNSSRSADVKALTDCRLAAIDEYAFRFLIEKVPDFALDLLRVLAIRLRAMNTI